jgi:hypothetical protein
MEKHWIECLPDPGELLKFGIKQRCVFNSLMDQEAKLEFLKSEYYKLEDELIKIANRKYKGLEIHLAVAKSNLK